MDQRRFIVIYKQRDHIAAEMPHVRMTERIGDHAEKTGSRSHMRVPAQPDDQDIGDDQKSVDDGNRVKCSSIMRFEVACQIRRLHSIRQIP